MKSLLRHILVNLLALYLASLIVTGLSWGSDLKVLLLAAVALGLINIIVRPIVKLIAFPLNVATLGLFTVVINAAMLYLVTLLIPSFRISPFYFAGLNLSLIIIPAAHVPLLAAFMVAALVIGVISTFVSWLTASK